MHSTKWENNSMICGSFMLIFLQDLLMFLLYLKQHANDCAVSHSMEFSSVQSQKNLPFPPLYNVINSQEKWERVLRTNLFFQ